MTPLSSLSELLSFSVNGNGIFGTIPRSFLSMPKMQTLSLGGQLTGSIPPITSVNSQLLSISLGYTLLEGSIPESFGMLTGLQMLSLRYNSITGTIPESFGMLTGLQSLYLGDNLLAGTIPSTLRRLCNLKSLSLRNNQLSGTIPVLNQSSLQVIDLSQNYLTMGSLREVPLSTFSPTALAYTKKIFINLRSNCLVFRHPSNPATNVNATHCGGEQVC